MSKPTYEELEAQLHAVVAENAALKEALTAVINRSSEPEYHYAGMGCGVEDNGLQADGYGACEYGWREAMQRVYSEVIPEALPDFPATDAILASLRAEGINFAASRLAAAYNHGFIDKPLAEVSDVVRMILTAKGELANNPAADGLSGEYAEKALVDWASQLRSQSEQPKNNDDESERNLFEEWVRTQILISKCTLEGLRTDYGYRNSTLSGTDYNKMWLDWISNRRSSRQSEQVKGVQS